MSPRSGSPGFWMVSSHDHVRRSSLPNYITMIIVIIMQFHSR